MTTSPDGQPVPVSQRLAEIRARYGPGHTVTCAITKSAPQITTAVHRVTSRLAARTAGEATSLSGRTAPGACGLVTINETGH